MSLAGWSDRRMAPGPSARRGPLAYLLDHPPIAAASVAGAAGAAFYALIGVVRTHDRAKRLALSALCLLQSAIVVGMIRELSHAHQADPPRQEEALSPRRRSP